MRIGVGTTVTYPLREPGDRRATPIALDLHPLTCVPGEARLRLTMSARPMGTSTADGVSRYSIGVRFAEIVVTVDAGTIMADPVELAEVTVERTSESGRERGLELKPKVGVKAGTEGAGLELEGAAFAAKSTSGERQAATGTDRRPDVRQDLRSDRGVVYWTVTPSLLAPPNAVLRFSRTLTIDCRWTAAHTGSVRLVARRHIACEGDTPIDARLRVLKRFIIWKTSAPTYEPATAQPFEIVQVAA